MTLGQALVMFMVRLMGNQTFDNQVLTETAYAIADVTSDLQEAETLARISRYESGGFRKDIADCRTRGDHGAALGLFQVHPFTEQEFIDLCSKNYRDQVRAALSHVRDSRAICKMHGYSGSALLTIYTNGSCRASSDAARLRWGSGQALQAFVWTEYNQLLHKKNVGYEEAEME